jgi:serine/threonine protein kinase
MISDHYEVDLRKVGIIPIVEVLGQSVYGQVIKARHKDTQAYFAVKIVPKNRVKNADRFIKEVSIL